MEVLGWKNSKSQNRTVNFNFHPTTTVSTWSGCSKWKVGVPIRVGVENVPSV